MVHLLAVTARLQSSSSTRLKAMVPRILLPTAAFLWAISLWQAQLRIGPYGLIHSLPRLFFVAVILLNASFLAALRWTRKETLLLAGHLLAFVAFVDLIPIILEGTPRFPWVYDSYGYADYIVRNGHLNLGLTYHNWPALHLLNAAVVQVTGIDPISLLLWAPSAIRVFTLLVFTLLCQRLCASKQELWMALWLVVLFGVGAGYCLPGTLASLLLMVILYLVVSPLLGKSLPAGNGVGYQALLVVLLGALVSAHFLTSVAVVVDLAFLYALAHSLKRRGMRLSSITLSGVLVLFWFFYVAVNTTLPSIPRLFNEILAFDVLATRTQQAALGGSAEHTVVFLVRLGYMLVLSLLALAAFWYRVISERRLRLNWAVPAAWVGGSVTLVLLTPYAGEILARSFALAFFALLILAAKHGTGFTSPLLACIVSVAAVLYPINAWGNERVDYVPASEIAAAELFYAHRPSSYRVTTYPVRIWHHRYMEEHSRSGPDSWRFTMVGTPSEQAESFLTGSTEITRSLRDQVTHSGHVYTSGSIDVFAQRGDVAR